MKYPPELNQIEADYEWYRIYCRKNNLQRVGFYQNFYGHWRTHLDYNNNNEKDIRKKGGNRGTQNPPLQLDLFD